MTTERTDLRFDDNGNLTSIATRDVHHIVLPEYQVKMGGPKKGKSASEFNTVMTFDEHRWEFDTYVNFHECSLTAALWQAACDFKTTWQNNNRIKREDSAAVKQAKARHLQTIHESGKLTISAKVGGKAGYNVSPQDALTALVANPAETKRTLEQMDPAARAKLVETLRDLGLEV